MTSTEAALAPDTDRAPLPAGGVADPLVQRFDAVRAQSERLAAPLTAEDMVAQSMPDASPAKWHLAHTTWFFEAMVLREARPELPPFDPAFHFLFNSYYNALGAQFNRSQRGLVTRPGVERTREYRAHVDAAIRRFLRAADAPTLARWGPVVELGLHHEQQHQELLVTDLKHLLSHNPLDPAYRERGAAPARAAPPLRWHEHGEGVVSIGHDGDGFAYDNEGPRHRVFLAPFALASRPVTCGEYLEFIADGGYRRPEPWLSEGWATVQAQGWEAPLYWRRDGDDWRAFTLAGRRPIDPAEPVCHVSYFEADAYARWAGARLPTEQEWETVAAGRPIEGNFVDDELFHPRPTPAASDGVQDLFGNVWEWTSSSYAPYPGYRPAAGAIGEYNGKFMCNQYVLRGGSFATPRSHIRASYRNFFPAHCRWQAIGLRLAQDRR